MTKIFSETENVIEAIFKMIDLMIDHFQNMSPAFQMDLKRYHNEILKNLEKRMSYHITGTILK
jgi:archaellum biogenesis protein FlaJ (TadC family)